MTSPNISYAYLAGALETAMKYLVSDLYGKGIIKDYDADKVDAFVADKIAYLYQKEREFSGVPKEKEKITRTVAEANERYSEIMPSMVR